MTLLLLLALLIALSVAIALVLNRMLTRRHRAARPRRLKPVRPRTRHASSHGVDSHDHYRHRDDSNLVGTLGAVGLAAALVSASESAGDADAHLRQDCDPETGDSGSYGDCSSDSGSDGGGGGDGGGD